MTGQGQGQQGGATEGCCVSSQLLQDVCDTLSAAVCTVLETSAISCNLPAQQPTGTPSLSQAVLMRCPDVCMSISVLLLLLLLAVLRLP